MTVLEDFRNILDLLEALDKPENEELKTMLGKKLNLFWLGNSWYYREKSNNVKACLRGLIRKLKKERDRQQKIRDTKREKKWQANEK